MTGNKKGKMTSMLIPLLIIIIIGVAVVIPVSLSVVSSAIQPTTSTVAVTISNTNGTLLTTNGDINLYINKYVNTNVTLYNTAKNATLKAAAVNSSDFVRLFVNGTAITSYSKGTSTDTYALNASKFTLYKITAQSNASGAANSTEWIILSPTQKTISTPINPIIITLLALIPLLIAVLIILYFAKIF